MPNFPASTLQLFLTAEELWSRGVRPWVESGLGKLEQSYIVVATRGQAQGLKQRFVEDGVPLLGVEFLTPGLARRKGIAGRSAASRPAMGRELLLFGLRRLIEERCLSAEQDSSLRSYWHSLRTDAERALDDWDSLVRSGHGARDWSSPLMREIFEELELWINRMGYAPAAVQEREVVRAGAKDDDPVADRVLVAGLGAELSGEFWGVAGLVQRSREATVWVPEPDFAGGQTQTQERWVDRWQTLLEVEPLPSEAEKISSAGAGAAALLAPQSDASPDLTGTRVRVGQSRNDEMSLVVSRIAGWLGDGAKRVGVVVPMDNAAHLQLRQELMRRNIDFDDQLPVAGPPSLDVRIQQGILRYHAAGCRVEGLLELWPRLLASGATTLSQAKVRRLLDRSFEKCQRHEVADHVRLWRDKDNDLATVLELLGEPWPDELSLTEGLSRFCETCERLDVADPEAIQSLDALAGQDDGLCSRKLMAESIGSLLPDQFPATDGARKAGFAPVIIGSWRRLVGVEWTHLVFTQCNASVWPIRASESPWWTESDRQLFLSQNASDAGLLTAAEIREVDIAGMRRIARDTTTEVLLSGALHEDTEPDGILAPNMWLERYLVCKGYSQSAGGIGQAMQKLSRQAGPIELAENYDLSQWAQIERRRRDPRVPFDEWFHAGEPKDVVPDHISPRMAERSVQDPAEFWYEAVLGVSRIDREDFQRQRNRTMGLLAHDLVARALQPHHEIAAGFGPLPSAEDARQSLAASFEEWHRQQSKDVYWQTFSAELEAVTQGLLRQALNLDAGKFVATELWLPPDAKLSLARRDLALSGRMDLVRSDRPGWKDADVDIVDFKTGGDIAMSAKKMRQSGKSLQLGIYLAAARSLGAATARVWMVKPGENEVSVVSSEELDAALASLGWLDTALERGVVGALTPDQSEYSFSGYEWPRAVRPISESVLRQKYALTFASNTTTEGAKS